MVSTTAKTIIQFLRNILSQLGLHEKLVSGNKFVTAEFKECLQRNDVKHIATSAYHPNSNGLAERAIISCKNERWLPANITCLIPVLLQDHTTEHYKYVTWRIVIYLQIEITA